jgi:hypothetical protein
MTINADTKIGAILKENPEALEAIVSISTRFEKLRNPLLRKIMAPRTTLSMASRVGGCSVSDFLKNSSRWVFNLSNQIIQINHQLIIIPYLVF